MDLVVARHPPAVRVVHQAGRRDARLARDAQRQGSGDDPEAELARQAGERVLDRPVAFLLGDGELVRLGVAHEGEILRQRRDVRAALAALAQQRAHGREVAANVGTGNHLQGGDSGHWPRSSVWAAGGAGSGAALPTDAEMRSTSGSDHGPVTR